MSFGHLFDGLTTGQLELEHARLTAKVKVNPAVQAKLDDVTARLKAAGIEPAGATNPPAPKPGRKARKK